MGERVDKSREGPVAVCVNEASEGEAAQRGRGLDAIAQALSDMHAAGALPSAAQHEGRDLRAGGEESSQQGRIRAIKDTCALEQRKRECDGGKARPKMNFGTKK